MKFKNLFQRPGDISRLCGLKHHIKECRPKKKTNSRSNKHRLTTQNNHITTQITAIITTTTNLICYSVRKGPTSLSNSFDQILSWKRKSSYIGCCCFLFFVVVIVGGGGHEGWSLIFFLSNRPLKIDLFEELE